MSPFVVHLEERMPKLGIHFFAMLLMLYRAEVRADEPVVDTSRNVQGSVAERQWPHIRGADWTGIAHGEHLVDQWPTEGPPVLWTRELGQGYSSFVVWGNHAATQYQTLSGQYVLCLNADTGETVWQYRYDWPYDPAGVYPGPRATPTYANGKIYFASPAGLIGCLDAADGRLLWSVSLPEFFGGEMPGFGYSCSPTIADGLVYLPVGIQGAAMVALDADSGRAIWHVGDEAASYAPAYPITFQGRKLLLGYLENDLVCHDRRTGIVLWRHKLSEGYDEHSSWPLYQEPYLWISSPFRSGCELLELTSNADAPVRSLGKRSNMSNDIFSSVLIDQAVFGFDVHDAQAKTHRSTRGIFRCVDFLSGKEYWSVGDGRPLRSVAGGVPTTLSSEDGIAIGHATVISADGKLVLFNDLGELILARASTEGYHELGRTSILSGEICWTQPALCNGRLLVRNHSRAAGVYLGNLSDLAPELRQQTIAVSDIPQRAYFDWASVILRVEPEYAFDLPSGQWLQQWFRICLYIMSGCLLVPGFWSLVEFTRSRKPAMAQRVDFKGADPLLTGTETKDAAIPARTDVTKGAAPSQATVVEQPANQLPKVTKRQTIYWVSVMVAGSLGTTVLSSWLNDFVFTWPVVLFAAYQMFIDRIAFSRRQLSRDARIQSGLAVVFFVLVCLTYFLVCRRLSLVFEWVFLIGFAAAVPCSLAARFLFARRRWYGVWRLAMTVVGFAAFYWSSAAFLYWRVR